MINESLHTEITLKKGEFFVKERQKNHKIGQCLKGVLRGFINDDDGDEITTHFFIENDLISGNYIPNANATVTIQAMEDCLISVANYEKVFSFLNTDNELTKVILNNFQKLNKQNTSRIEALINSDSFKKYKWFLAEYPNLLNRIPHYHIASFLGITPTQLSRTRKAFSQHM